MRLLPCSPLLLAATLPALADTVKPIYFGPYMVNQVTYTGNPLSYRYALNNIFYRFQVSWIEPISETSEGILKDTYFEIDGDLNISPYQSDVGTTFNLKPIRYLELGLSYNRLMFHNTMVTWSDTDISTVVPEKSRPGDILIKEGELGGADVFTFQANFTLDMGPAQLFLLGSRALWDVDATGQTFIYEYSNDLVIKARDRINILLGKLNFDLSRFSTSKVFTFTGVSLRNQYWFTDHTEQRKNLVSFGVTGLRFGRNPERHRRGLDVSLGYWTEHPQLKFEDWARSVSFLFEWKWNVQFLKM